MPKVQNTFLKGRMDSDTNYSLIGNDTYVYAENGRISGEGNDGAFKCLKGSKLVSETYSENGGVIIRAFEGRNNKTYYFIALPNKKSKIVEYDVETETSRLVISDNQFLRFDLIIWYKGTVIFPYKYLLGVNQIGKYLLISDRVWRYPRIIDTERDYSLGFTEQEIILNKKPPFYAPIISNKVLDTTIADEESKNKFISFAYRYKYKDGIYSTLSFYTNASFEPQLNKKIEASRKNKGMENRFNKLDLIINTGSADVTDIEVYAREHNSNTAYMIYSANKAEKGIGSDTIHAIEYSYSKNYEVLSETETKELYSNVPMFPNSQENVGNRMFYLNYTEGFDLKDKDGNNVIVDYEVFKTQKNYVLGGDNRTAVSLNAYKVSPIFLNDYNISTSALLPSNQNKAEVTVGFDDRTKVNGLQVKFTDTFKAPEFATKMKFVVKRETLNYENLYITYAKRISADVYLLLTSDNISRVKKDDIIIRTDIGADKYKEFKVEEVKSYTIEDGLNVSGLYAKVKDENKEIDLVYNGTNIRKKFTTPFPFPVIDAYPDSTEPKRYDATSGYSGSYGGNNWDSARNSLIFKNSDYGSIKEGDTFEFTISFSYGRDKKGRGEDAVDIYGKIEITENLYASSDYILLGDFLKDNIKTPYINVENNGNDVKLLTNSLFPDLVREKIPNMWDWGVNYGNRDERAIVKISYSTNLTRGIDPIIFRTKNKDNTEEVFFYETSKTYPIRNGNIIPDDVDGSKKVFNIDFYNGYSWGDGTESYKIRDEFNGKALNFNFRGTAYEINGYKAKVRNDITWSGKYNEALGINQLGSFNSTEVNWKEVPMICGEGQRLISSDNNLTIYCENKVALAMYEKSIIYDINGVETVGLSDQVLGAVVVLDYEYGVGKNPESIVKSGALHYFIDPKRKRFLIKQGNQIEEINPIGSGFFNESQRLLTDYKSYLATYDDAHNEYVVGFDHKISLGFNMNYKGFTHYYSNAYEYLHSMNGKFFTAYNGKLYQNEVTNDYNNLVGQGKFASKLKFVCNPQIDSDKIFQAMYLQSNYAWNVMARTNLLSTKFSSNVFDKRESFFYTNIYGDNCTNVGIEGIGNVVSKNGNQLTFSYPISSGVSVGDVLVNNVTQSKSEITNIQDKVITVANGTIFSIGNFCYAEQMKVGDYRPNGVSLRGEWIEYTLSIIPEHDTYLTSVYTEVTKSNR